MLSSRFGAGVQHSSGDFLSHFTQKDAGFFLVFFRKLTQICSYTLKSRLSGASKEINNHGDMAMGFCVMRDHPKISSVMRDSEQICSVTRDLLFYKPVIRDYRCPSGFGPDLS